VLFTNWNDGNATFNNVSFDFAKFSHGHVEYKETGAKGDVTVAGWDFVANKAIVGPAPDADAGGAKILDSVDAGTNLDYYIRFDGISGGEWLRLENFNLGMSQTGSISTGGGAGTGKATASDVSSLLGSSSAVVELTEAVASGQHLKNVEIEAYRPGETKGGNLIDEFRFDDVLITGLSTGGHSSATASSVSFDFIKFGHAHVDYKEDGSKEGVTASGWDFLANKSTSGPSGAGDAAGAKLGDALDVGVDLDYYFTFDGAPGWLRLDAFSMGLSNTGSTSTGGGASTGQVQATDVSLTLGSSSEIVEITDLLLSGAHVKNVEIEAYRPGESKGGNLVDEYRFEDVIFTNWSNGNATANSVSFDFAKFSHGHVEYKETGAQGEVTVAGWDFAANKAYAGLLPDADVVF